MALPLLPPYQDYLYNLTKYERENSKILIFHSFSELQRSWKYSLS